jgi:GDP-L-fucose synthase
LISDKILNKFTGKSAVVTGGTGLIGRQVVDILCQAGAKVRIVSLDRLKVNVKAEHVFGDLTDFGFCREVMRDIDFVFHLAGIKGSASVSETNLASHFVPTLMMNTNVLESARMNKAHKVVYTSSIGAYTSTDVFREDDYRIDSKPMDFAGWAKRMAELQIHAYHRQHNLDNFAIVRPSNVYGPGDNFDPDNAMVVPSLMYRIHSEESPLVVWGDGSAIRDFVFSKDAAEGIILALHHGTQAKFVNLGSGQGVSIKKLLEVLQSFLDFSYVFDLTKPTGYPIRVMDTALAKELIGWEVSTPLAVGLKETWQWFLNNQDEYLKRKNYFIQESQS